ncbi:MAG TPA: alkylmercury lyase family protein [Kribbella sp.]|uniref:alkylmercury lyase family protein n=1 Tax=Kribbella sp. TaxID=1871183 RepID=UPI002D780419|nr:alkylmercury lyase family protein [Kribbella sp.]HET6299583.1 alkylmercury lyase family protein [Kribbella sp.]
MKLEVLHVPDCPNLAPLLQRLAEVTDQAVITRVIETDAEAAQYGMAGSPTLLIDGVDPFAPQGGCESGVSCRLYRDDNGRTVSAPSVEQLREAITSAVQQHENQGLPRSAGELLSSQRSRVLQLKPLEKAVHQTILRTFASTGRPPTTAELDVITSGSSSTEVLNALHEIDAIRLNSDGQIAVAYPFSATPTAHRVRIGDQVEVYAMCAADALGMSAMLGQDTQIESVDATTGQPITVTLGAGRTDWQPAEAVVFISADAGVGPSATTCCDYLNFFTNQTTAQAWITSHPHVPGQILTQTEAQELGINLFQPLLVD